VPSWVDERVQGIRFQMRQQCGSLNIFGCPFSVPLCAGEEAGHGLWDLLRGRVVCACLCGSPFLLLAVEEIQATYRAVFFRPPSHPFAQPTSSRSFSHCQAVRSCVSLSMSILRCPLHACR
jgi:hypothetical protein